jgi:protein-tyrosine-phosphatase
VRSAGAGAVDGEPVTPESVAAVRTLGIDDRDLPRHLSRELTRQMIAEADVVYAMTAAHVRLIESMAPQPPHGARIVTLDPTGEDIPDPVGSPQDVYTRTAERLREAIERRLSEAE